MMHIYLVAFTRYLKCNVKMNLNFWRVDLGEQKTTKHTFNKWSCKEWVVSPCDRFNDCCAGNNMKYLSLGGLRNSMISCVKWKSNNDQNTYNIYQYACSCSSSPDEEELRLGWTNPNQQHHHHQHGPAPSQHHHHHHHQQQPAGHTGPRQHRTKQPRGQQRPSRDPAHPNGQPQPSPRRAAQVTGRSAEAHLTGVYVYNSTRGMPLVQSNYMVGTNCCVKCHKAPLEGSYMWERLIFDSHPQLDRHSGTVVQEGHLSEVNVFYCAPYFCHILIQL